MTKAQINLLGVAMAVVLFLLAATPHARGATYAVASPPAPPYAGKADSPSAENAQRLDLDLISTQIPAKGPIRVHLTNPSDFAVSGRLTTYTIPQDKRATTLPFARFKLAAKSHATVRLRLTSAVEAVLASGQDQKLSLRASVAGAGGSTFSSQATVGVRAR